MIALTFDIATGAARFTQPAVIKLSADVPVRVTFSAAPGEVVSVNLLLGTDGASPSELAQVALEEESATIWAGLLDTADARLVAHLDGKGQAAVNAELVALIDGAVRVTPHLSVTVQQRITG